MFNSGILDTVIGVVVIFLQLSLVCTAVNELAALLLKKRAKELEKGIRTLLTSPQLVEKFYARTCSSRACDRTKKTFLHSLAHFCVGAHGHCCKASLLLTGAVRAATQPVADKETERLSAQLARTLQSPPYKRRRVFGRLRLRHLHTQPPRI